MMDSLLNLFFRCGHRRTSFPRKAATKPGEPEEAMYVVCLDCGKQFHYDWERMRVGAEIPAPPPQPFELDAKPPARAKPKLRYLVALTSLPVVWLIGKAARGWKRSHPGPNSPDR